VRISRDGSFPNGRTRGTLIGYLLISESQLNFDQYVVVRIVLFSTNQWLNETFNVWSLSSSARVIIPRPSLHFLGAIRALTKWGGMWSHKDRFDNHVIWPSRRPALDKFLR